MNKLTDSRALPYLMLALAVFFWSVNAVIGRGVVGTVPPVSLSFWRWALALVLFLPFAWRDLVAGWPIIRRHWRAMAVLSFLGVTVFNTLQYLALQYTQAINASLFNAIMPAVVVALSWMILQVRTTALQGLGILLAIGGVLTIVTRGDPARLTDMAFNPGDLVMIVAVITWGLYSVLVQRYRPPGLSGKALFAATMVIGVPLLVPLYVWELALGYETVIGLPAFGAIVYTAIFPSIISFLLWNGGIARAGANAAGVLINLNPVYTAVLASLFLDESLYGYHFQGIGLVFIGV